MEDFVAYNSKFRLALLLLVALAFVLLGLWMAGEFGSPPSSARYPEAELVVVGWFSVVFFGFCGLVAIKRFFDPRDQLMIGSSGIRSRPWSDQIIPWTEITDVTTWSYKRTRTIILHLRNPSRFPAQGSLAVFKWANKQLTGGDVTISMTGTDCSFDDAMAAIRRFRH